MYASHFTMAIKIALAEDVFVLTLGHGVARNIPGVTHSIKTLRNSGKNSVQLYGLKTAATPL
jgi:hypothetical protein